jgi:hypothetical protein
LYHGFAAYGSISIHCPRRHITYSEFVMDDSLKKGNQAEGYPTAKGKPAREKPGFLSGVQYFYFLRFSLLYLLVAPFLAYEDWGSGISSITRGIFTPAKWYDFLGEEFFLACVGVIGLVTTRLVVMNGKDRFGVEPPRWLADRLGSDSDSYAARMLLYFQIPGLGVLAYLHFTAHKEEVSGAWTTSLLMSAMGLALAFVFWGSLNIIYYWTADDGTGRPPRTILLPRRWLRLPEMSEATRFEAIKPPAFVSKIWELMAGLGPGYSDDSERARASESGTIEKSEIAPPGGVPSADKEAHNNDVAGDDKGIRSSDTDPAAHGRKAQLYSGHRFASIAAVGYLLVYIFLFPLTSPFTGGIGYTVSLVAFGILTIVLTVVIFRLQPPTLAWAKYLIAFELSVLSIGAWCLEFHIFESSQTFPVLCSVLVLLSLIALVICGIAFLIDRIHILVILAFAFLLFVVHTGVGWLYLIPGLNNSLRFGGYGDHYFEVLDLKHAPAMASPKEILRERNCGDAASPVRCPIIIVSATGGGIHAAAWTTLMLTELETAFQSSADLSEKGFTFHNGVALYSTVSGGSVGLLPFLNEYYADHPFSKDEWQDKQERMFTASGCSTLEAVAWGFEYRDFDVALAPWASGLFSPKWDRSAALEAGIHRHLFTAPCEQPEIKGVPEKEEKTLGNLAEDLKYSVDNPNGPARSHAPAFSMNTTAAETGGRFLLSNYHVTPDAAMDDGVAPAEDFLFAYESRAPRSAHPDIRLSTAARLSATFPYVSSAARSDQIRDDDGTLHYVDGGYYDNDGIASVVEFLLAGKSAIAKDPYPNDHMLNVPILLIEIRDGLDLDSTQSPEANAQEPVKQTKCDNPPCKQAKATKWNVTSQLSAPLGAFWAAGHEAVTRRNRRELEVLMELLGKEHVAFRHIVLDYKEPSEAQRPSGEGSPRGSAQPLSWFLTPSQQKRIKKSKKRVGPCILEAVKWATDGLQQKETAAIQNNISASACALETPEFH